MQVSFGVISGTQSKGVPMRITAFLAIFSLITSIGIARTIHVPGSHNTIQEAIDKAVNGDVVLVAPGTYVENIDYKGKLITLKSTHGPESTCIDGSRVDRVVQFLSGEGPESILDGFHIRNGLSDVGGGIVIWYSSATLLNNIISDNSSTIDAGGVFIVNTDDIVRVMGNVIRDNLAGDEGGGIYCYGVHSLILERN